MKEFVTSDLHFGHKNIMSFCPRTRGHYVDVDQMNQDLTDKWNRKIAKQDTVYVLGDVCFMNLESAVSTVQGLNGRKILIQGNHDRKLLKKTEFRDCWEEIHTYLDINRNGTKIVMFHYPLAEWDQQYRGSVHLYGHLHGNPSGVEHYRALDVGCDATGEIALSLDEAVARAMRGAVKVHSTASPQIA
jgi:calcineurin-like phosphoesterase family protein